nr:hypothetical protein [Bacillus salacetis]
MDDPKRSEKSLNTGDAYVCCHES